MRLEDKVSVITGAGSGMGRVAALRFAAEGSRVVVADNHGEAAEETVRQVRAAGGEATAVARVIAAGFSTAGRAPQWLLDSAPQRCFVQSTHDQYGPREKFEQLFNALPEPKRIVWIEARAHFFAGGLDELEEAVAGL